MTKLIEKKSKLSPTAVDRALEEFSLKLLQGHIADDDLSEYERLLSVRTKRLVKLPSARALGATRWLKDAG